MRDQRQSTAEVASMVEILAPEMIAVVIAVVVVVVILVVVVVVVKGVEEGTTKLVRFPAGVDCCAKNLMQVSDVNSFV